MALFGTSQARINKSPCQLLESSSISDPSIRPRNNSMVTVLRVVVSVSYISEVMYRFTLRNSLPMTSLRQFQNRIARHRSTFGQWQLIKFQKTLICVGKNVLGICSNFYLSAEI